MKHMRTTPLHPICERLSKISRRIVTCIMLGLAWPLFAAPPEWSVESFGARGDGRTIATRQIQAAINHAAEENGGGIVTISNGVYLSGALMLKPGVSLRIDVGGVLKGSEDIADYPVRTTRIEGQTIEWRPALLNGDSLSGIKIFGGGEINGSGPVFWRAFWQRRAREPDCENLSVHRPRLIFLSNCKDIEISGLQLKDSGFWNLHLYRCEDVLIEDLSITVPSASESLRAASTDGIDVDSSRNITIRRCYISTHDDNIALKGDKGPRAGVKSGSMPVENIDVYDCVMGSGNGLITCGSEATEIRHVRVRDCKMTGDATVLTLKLRHDTPQYYHDIKISNVELNGNGRVLNISPWNYSLTKEKYDPPPHIVEDVTLENIHGTYGSIGAIDANPYDILRNIRLENIAIQAAETGVTFKNTSSISLHNVRIEKHADTGRKAEHETSNIKK